MTRTAGKRGGKLFALQSKPSDAMMLSPRISETFIPAKYVRSLVWSDDSLVDRVGGSAVYHLDGSCEHCRVIYAFNFDAALCARRIRLCGDLCPCRDEGPAAPERSNHSRAEPQFLSRARIRVPRLPLRPRRPHVACSLPRAVQQVGDRRRKNRRKTDVATIERAVILLSLACQSEPERRSPARRWLGLAPDR